MVSRRTLRDIYVLLNAIFLINLSFVTFFLLPVAFYGKSPVARSLRSSHTVIDLLGVSEEDMPIQTRVSLKFAPYRKVHYCLAIVTMSVFAASIRTPWRSWVFLAVFGATVLFVSLACSIQIHGIFMCVN